MLGSLMEAVPPTLSGASLPHSSAVPQRDLAEGAKPKHRASRHVADLVNHRRTLVCDEDPGFEAVSRLHGEAGLVQYGLRGKKQVDLAGVRLSSGQPSSHQFESTLSG